MATFTLPVKAPDFTRSIPGRAGDTTAVFEWDVLATAPAVTTNDVVETPPMTVPHGTGLVQFAKATSAAAADLIQLYGSLDQVTWYMLASPGTSNELATSARNTATCGVFGYAPFPFIKGRIGVAVATPATFRLSLMFMPST
jgi:hypothetical protein